MVIRECVIGISYDFVWSRVVCYLSEFVECWEGWKSKGCLFNVGWYDVDEFCCRNYYGCWLGFWWREYDFWVLFCYLDDSMGYFVYSCSRSSNFIYFIVVESEKYLFVNIKKYLLNVCSCVIC